MAGRGDQDQQNAESHSPHRDPIRLEAVPGMNGQVRLVGPPGTMSFHRPTGDHNGAALTLRGLAPLRGGVLRRLDRPLRGLNERGWLKRFRTRPTARIGPADVIFDDHDPRDTRRLTSRPDVMRIHNYARCDVPGARLCRY